MPYPVVHVLFFLFCVGAVAVYATTGSLSRRELSSRDSRKLLLLMFVGGISSLLPDIMVVYNLPVHGNMYHCWIGPVATHSFLFSSVAVVFGAVVGYVAYRESNKAGYMAIFAWSAFLSHLLLDDITEGGCEYLYPLSDGRISVFSMMETGFSAGLFHYLMASFVSVSFIFIVIMMALFSLSRFGFEYKYRAEK